MANDLKGSIITAQDARIIADSTDSLLKHIYKAIRECSKDGVTRLTWSICNMSKSLVDSAVEHLRSNGYEVFINLYKDFEAKIENPVELQINW